MISSYFKQHHASKNDSYCSHYDEIIKTINPKKILEIGCLPSYDCPSMRSFSKTFPDAVIVGIDHDPQQGVLPSNIRYYQGNQTDRDFLNYVALSEGPFDLIIDDGGHYGHEQQISLLCLFHHLTKNGLYIVEDLHVCIERKSTFIDTRTFIKKLFDNYTFYDDSLCVIKNG